MTDKFKDQDSMLPAATSDKKKISAKPAKSGQVIINPPEKVDPQRGFQERFQALRAKHSVVLEKKTELVLQSKATRSEFPQEVIEQVYKRGFKALPLNTELTREQYAMNRVNSFIAGGAAMVEDCDLLPITERIHTRIGMKGTGGGARPHIKREKSPYNNRMVYHVVDAKGIVKHSTGDEFEAKKHLASKYNAYMGESTISPMKRFEGTKSLVKTYKADTPGQAVKEETLSELNKDTVYSYASKADKDITKKHNELGAQIRADKNAEANKTSMKISRRDKGIDRAQARLNKEEAEQIDELSKSTLTSYISKAKKVEMRSMRSILARGKGTDLEKRQAGIKTAREKIKESAICATCQADPCICDDSHGFVGEARMSASERFSRAFDKQRAKSDASLRRTPSSIPKKEEPKKEVAEGLAQTLRKVVPGYAKREIDNKMDAGKFGKTDADKDANFQRYKKIQDKIKEQGVK